MTPHSSSPRHRAEDGHAGLHLTALTLWSPSGLLTHLPPLSKHKTRDTWCLLYYREKQSCIVHIVQCLTNERRDM